LATENSAAINMGIQIPPQLDDFDSLGYKDRKWYGWITWKFYFFKFFEEHP
jgi:hypothetical protein